MLPDSSSPDRLPAPSPCRACMVSKAGWITALVTTLLAAFFFFRFLSANADANLQRNNAELTRVELQSMKQQLYAERILSERQISDLAANAKSETVHFVKLAPSDAAATQSSGILVWLPARQSGVVFAEQLPPIAADEELRLWIEDGPGSSRVAAGTINASPNRETKVDIKAEKPLPNAAKFTVTREHKGATAPSGPVILSGSL